MYTYVMCVCTHQRWHAAARTKHARRVPTRVGVRNRLLVGARVTLWGGGTKPTTRVGNRVPTRVCGYVHPLHDPRTLQSTPGTHLLHTRR